MLCESLLEAHGFWWTVDLTNNRDYGQNTIGKIRLFRSMTILFSHRTSSHEPKQGDHLCNTYLPRQLDQWMYYAYTLNAHINLPFVSGKDSLPVDFPKPSDNENSVEVAHPNIKPFSVHPLPLVSLTPQCQYNFAAKMFC